MEPTTKICAKCLLEQPIENFGINRQAKDGRYFKCKSCRYIENRSSEQRERQKLANERHRKTEGYKKKMLLHGAKYRKSELGIINRKKYVSEHKDELKNYMKEYAQKWAQTPEGIASRKKAQSKLYYKDIEKSRAYQREAYQKRKQSIEYRLNDAISSSIYDALKERKNGRRWEKIVGYTLSDIMIHLESLFLDGMSWDNYGKWHIDHIIPRYTFTIDQIKECWALSNLQPLWAEDNMHKHKKILPA